jgi:hypothetical protein
MERFATFQLVRKAMPQSGDMETGPNTHLTIGGRVEQLLILEEAMLH